MSQPSRVIIRIELTPTSKELFSEVAERQGMTQLAVNSRVVEWFFKQPESVQQAILKHMYTVDKNAIAKLVLNKMAV